MKLGVVLCKMRKTERLLTNVCQSTTIRQNRDAIVGKTSLSSGVLDHIARSHYCSLIWLLFLLQIQQNRLRQNERQSPQFYSSTLSQPIGSRSSDTLDFVASRRIRIPADLERDRRLADRDEAIMVAESNAHGEPERPRSSQFNRPRDFGGSSRFDFSRNQGRPHSAAFSRPYASALTQERPYAAALSQNRPYAAALTASAPSSENYQSFQSQGASYSTNVGYPTYSDDAPSPTAVSSLVGFDFSGPAYGPVHGQARAPASRYPSRLSHPFSSPPSLPPIPTSTSIPVSPRLPTLGTPTVNYGGVVAHGTGGSYSYSSLGWISDLLWDLNWICWLELAQELLVYAILQEPQRD